MVKEFELLSPAGNIDSFKAACNSGADAIYMGVSKFNARAMAKNFDIEEYIECIKYAHIRGLKVYLTLNTIIFDNEIKDALNLVLELYSHGLDAVILQDIGLATLIKKYIPNILLHASTQMSVHSLEQVKYLEKIGFSRVVLARELNVDEIEYICKNTNLEIEVFVHGALCVSVSGQCLLSSQIGNRSANRGNCAQPCRMKYRLYDKNSKKILSKNTYILSKKDIYGLEMLKKLVDIGVHSFKIEGRNKTPEYVAIVTSIYRKYLDHAIKNINIKVEENDVKELMQTFNRNGLSNGYLNGIEYKKSITILSPKNTGIYLGEVLDTNKLFVKVKLEEDIDMHDGIEIYSKENIISTIVTCIKDEKNNIVNNRISKGNVCFIGDISRNVETGSKIYKTSSNKLNEKYNKMYLENKSKTRKSLDIFVVIKNNQKIKVFTNIFEKDINFEFDYIPQIAISKPTTKEQIIESFSRTEDTDFKFDNINIDIDESLFIPISILNKFRRNFLQVIYDNFDINVNVSKIQKDIDKIELNLQKEIIDKEKLINNKDSRNSLFIYNYSNNFDYLEYYKNKYNKKLDVIYLNIKEFLSVKNDILEKYKTKTNIYIYIPNVIFSNFQNIITDKLLEDLVIKGVQGFLISNIGYIDKLVKLKEKYHIKLVADYSLNISNSYSAIFFKKQGIDYITPSVETDIVGINEMSKYVYLEIFDDYITVMSSRYCIVGSFVSNRNKNEKCKMDCIKTKYILKDSYNENYDIITNNIDCTMNIVKKYESKQKVEKVKNIRNCII